MGAKASGNRDRGSANTRSRIAPQVGSRGKRTTGHPAAERRKGPLRLRQVKILPLKSLVGKDLKAFECIRAEGGDDGDIRGIAPSRYQDAPYAGHVIARIERIPSAA